jgi:EAL domain-containing protein (putative c-di-GMP-specific phosphodiesterase class I)
MRLAVDDAGAGYASMRHIIKLKPDLIKLDRAIIRDIDTEASHRALGAAMVGFAAETGAHIVAEGIETVAELKTVTSLGIAAGQGYLLGRPTLEPSDWEQWGQRAQRS